MYTALKLNFLEVPTEDQNQGKATEFIDSLCNFSDYYGTEVTLECPDHLTSFYSKFGFKIIGEYLKMDKVFVMCREATKGRVME